MLKESWSHKNILLELRILASLFDIKSFVKRYISHYLSVFRSFMFSWGISLLTIKSEWYMNWKLASGVAYVTQTDIHTYTRTYTNIYSFYLHLCNSHIPVYTYVYAMKTFDVIYVHMYIVQTYSATKWII